MSTLEGMSEGERFELVLRIVALLHKSAFRDRKRWPLAVVVLRGPGERSYVTSKIDFASFLRSNDVVDLARFCTRHRSRPGEVLIWIELDDVDVSAAFFETINLTREARALIAA